MGSVNTALIAMLDDDIIVDYRFPALFPKREVIPEVDSLDVTVLSCHCGQSYFESGIMVPQGPNLLAALRNRLGYMMKMMLSRLDFFLRRWSTLPAHRGMATDLGKVQNIAVEDDRRRFQLLAQELKSPEGC